MPDAAPGPSDERQFSLCKSLYSLCSMGIRVLLLYDDYRAVPRLGLRAGKWRRCPVTTLTLIVLQHRPKLRMRIPSPQCGPLLYFWSLTAQTFLHEQLSFGPQLLR